MRFAVVLLDKLRSLGARAVINCVIWGALAPFLCALALSPTPVHAQDGRYAVVLGVDGYADPPGALDGAVEDAERIAAALASIGFRAPDRSDLFPQANADRATLVAAINRLAMTLSDADDEAIAVVYFAGHGAALDRRGDVYLLPSDARVRNAADLVTQGVRLSDVIEQLRAPGRGAVIVVVDACRNVVPLANPAEAARLAQGAGWGDGVEPVGLLGRSSAHRFDPASDPGSDYMVAFSTSPDRVAYDGGVFSSILSEELVAERRDVIQMFKTVAERMAEASTGYAQKPTFEIGVYSEPPCLVSCGARPDPNRFVDCAFCPWMMRVPVKEGVLGSPEDEDRRDRDEPPLHAFTPTRAYAVGEYEVSRAEWRACERAGACRVLTDKGEWLSDRAPITDVTLVDAQAYVAWLSRMSGANYRLPNEDEWEFAARAGTTGPFAFGRKIEPSDAAYDYSASYNGSRRTEYYGAPEAVGSFEPNAFGVYDMHGNVWEWTGDCYEPDASTQECREFVVRGGSFKSTPAEARSANRFKLRPSRQREDVGFRVVRDL
jgi:formylglycine-generating enzyme required for sulfatase activity